MATRLLGWELSGRARLLPPTHTQDLGNHWKAISLEVPSLYVKKPNAGVFHLRDSLKDKYAADHD